MASKSNIRTVAKKAGVSVATVSGILNHSDRHSPETAAKVRAVMRELDYIPRRNALRRSPKKRKEQIKHVGVLFPDTNLDSPKTPLAKALAKGAQKALAEQNIEVDVLQLNGDGTLPDRINKKQLDGLIIRAGCDQPGGDGALHEELEASGIPVVWTFGSSSLPADADVVRMEDRGCGTWAAQEIPPSYQGACYVVKPAKSVLDIEARALAFTFQLRERGFQTIAVERDSPQANALMNQSPTQKQTTLFVPGHDHDVVEVYQKWVPQLSKKGHDVTMLAIMTDNTPLKPYRDATIKVLHIDPYRIGIAAAWQLLARAQTPWAEPVKLLVMAKEFKKARKPAQSKVPS